MLGQTAGLDGSGAVISEQHSDNVQLSQQEVPVASTVSPEGEDRSSTGGIVDARIRLCGRMRAVDLDNKPEPRARSGA